MKKLCVAMCFALVGGVFSAYAEKTHSKTDFWVRPGLSGTDFDWTSKDSYQKSASNPSGYDYAPEAGDVIVLPENFKAAISSTDTAEIELVRNMAAIVFYKSAELEIDLASDMEWNSAIYGASEAAALSGKVVKKGSGNLQLMSYGYISDYTTTVEWKEYYIGWDVQSGTLTMVNCLEKRRNRWGTSLNVESGATLNVGTGTGTSGDTLAGQIIVYGSVTGAGTIVNADSGRSSCIELRGRNDYCYSKFDGSITGKIAMRLYGQDLELTSNQSSFSGGISIYDNNNDKRHTTLGFAYFGGTSGLSSLGTGSLSIQNTCTLRCIGNEYSYGSKGCYWIGWNPVIDGGAYGNFECNNNFGMQSSYKKNTAMTFTGSNTVECVFRGQFSEKKDDSDHLVSARIIKDGTGTWYFKDNSGRCNGGVIEVNEGTLAFQSIAEVGTVCSLGRADALFESYEGDYDELKKVEHAFELGSTKATTAIATMEYRGTSDKKITTRKFALKGEGCLKTAENAGALEFTGFGLLAGQTAATLHLDSGNVNKKYVAHDIDAGSGKIDIVKDGAGSWTLNGKLAGIGGITVNGGTLTYKNNVNYEYYRLVIKEAISAVHNKTNSYAQISELGLFDKDGNRQNLGLTYVVGSSNVDELPVGQFIMVNYAGTKAVNYDRAPNGMFDDSKTNLTNKSGNSCANSVQINSGNGSYYNINNSATWSCVVMHLDPLHTNPVTALDMVSDYGSNGDYMMSAWSLEGSVDGHNWTEVCNSTDAGFVYNRSTGYWYKANKYYSAGDTAVGKVKTDSFPVDAYTPPTVTSTGLALSVGSAGTLNLSAPITVNKLTVDVGQGFGNVEGVTLESTGVLALTGVDDPREEILVSGINVIDNPGFANIANWAVSINGRTTGRKAEVDKDGYVTVKPCGAIFLVR